MKKTKTITDLNNLTSGCLYMDSREGSRIQRFQNEVEWGKLGEVVDSFEVANLIYGDFIYVVDDIVEVLTR